MIGWLSGKLLYLSEPLVGLNVDGVGYEIECATNSFAEMPKIGNFIDLYVHLQSRDDGQYLFGFLERSERDCFRMLIKINGVGPKLAISILSGISIKELKDSVENENWQNLTRLSGVGRKTAERLIIELRGWASLNILTDLKKQDSHNMRLDAEKALIGLGYRADEAKKAVTLANNDNTKSLEELIRKTLAIMSQAKS